MYCNILEVFYCCDGRYCLWLMLCSPTANYNFVSTHVLCFLSEITFSKVQVIPIKVFILLGYASCHSVSRWNIWLGLGWILTKASTNKSSRLARERWAMDPGKPQHMSASLFWKLQSGSPNWTNWSALSDFCHTHVSFIDVTTTTTPEYVPLSSSSSLSPLHVCF